MFVYKHCRMFVYNLCKCLSANVFASRQTFQNVCRQTFRCLLQTCILCKSYTVSSKSANSLSTMFLSKSAMQVGNASRQCFWASRQCKSANFQKVADKHQKVCRLTLQKFADLLCRIILDTMCKSAKSSRQSQVGKVKSAKQVGKLFLCKSAKQVGKLCKKVVGKQKKSSPTCSKGYTTCTCRVASNTCRHTLKNMSANM